MKNLIYLISFLALSMAMISCNKAPEGAKAVTGAAKDMAAKATMGAETYTVGTNSTITWTGSKPTGKHMGKFNISKGELKINDGKIEAGSFTIDMASNQVTDLQPGKGKEDLEGHLGAGDFFEVAKYPTGMFTLTSAEPVTGKASVTHSLTGDLKLKDKAHSVTFDANIAMGAGKISAVTPAFTINRTNWGINYKSGIINTAKDKLIHDDVAIVINLNAAK
jgi:polyisoprenoid-binding protein YceI